MSFKVEGFKEFANDLEDWADELDDVDFTRPKNRATRRASEELIEEIKENISKIPHNLQALRESWRYSRASHETTSVYTEKEYAPAFEYGTGPYIIEGNPVLAIDADDWDNTMAKTRLVDEYYSSNTSLSDVDTFVLPRVRHPGFEAYFYFTEAFLEMSEGGRFEEIVEEELVDKELSEAFD